MSPALTLAPRSGEPDVSFGHRIMDAENGALLPACPLRAPQAAPNPLRPPVSSMPNVNTRHRISDACNETRGATPTLMFSRLPGIATSTLGASLASGRSYVSTDICQGLHGALPVPSTIQPRARRQIADFSPASVPLAYYYAPTDLVAAYGMLVHYRASHTTRIGEGCTCDHLGGGYTTWSSVTLAW
eukprot:1025283-Rhodomonas_salina.4